jgi:tetratricopeptide (TPR) repeat protein
MLKLPQSPRRFLLLVLGALLLAGCSSPEERAAEARTEAEAALARGARGAAIAALERLRDNQPDTPETLLDLAALLIRAGEGPQVVWILEEGLERFPERDDLRLALANAALTVNDAATARRTLELVPTDSEFHARALLMLVQADLMLGDLESALDLLRAGEKRYPDKPAFQLGRIKTLLRENRLDEARKTVAEVRVGADDELLPHLRRIEASLLKADLRDARKRVLGTRSEPDAEKREQILADAATQQEAILAASQALVEEDRDDAVLWQALAEVYLQLGRGEEGIEQLAQAVEEDKERQALLPVMAVLERARGEMDKAEQLLVDFAAGSPSPSAALMLARFYMSSDRPLEAAQALGSAVEEFPGIAMLRMHLTETWLAAGDLDQARAEFGRFRDAAPRDPHVRFLQARLEIEEGDYRAAVDRLLGVVPDLDTATSQFWLGRALELSGDLEGAQRRYAVAMVRDPNLLATYQAIIELASRRGDWREVGSVAGLLVGRTPGDASAWLLIVSARLNLGEHAAAEAVARRAHERFPDDPAFLPLLSRALALRGQYEESEQMLADALETESTPELEAALAMSLGIAGRVPEALVIARKALDANPDIAELQNTLAALAFQQGDAAAGDRAVDRALELAPDDPSPLRMRTEFRLANGLIEGAIADCERLLEIRPDDSRMLYYLAVGREKAGEPEAAITAYRRAAELDELAFEPRNNLAELLRTRGDLDGALEMAQEAYAVSNGNPYVADTLGWMYVERGLPVRGVSLLEAAHEGAPDHPIVQLHLALAYRGAERTDDARRLLLDLQPRTASNRALAAQVDEALRSIE